MGGMSINFIKKCLLLCWIVLAVLGEEKEKPEIVNTMVDYKPYSKENFTKLNSPAVPILLPKDGDSEDDKKLFRVALVTAGSIRSFLFAEKSWHRYILEPWKENIFVFAHVIASNKKCQITNKGVDAMRELATEIEVHYTHSSLMSHTETLDQLHGVKSCLNNIFKKEGSGNNNKTGNIIDMYTRRSKAYDLALAYGRNNNIKWDLIMFTRPDSAFYAPKLELLKYYHALVNYSQQSNQRAILLPAGCAFGGFCDRFAIGLKDEMDVYFAKNQLFQVVEWATKIKPNQTLQMTKVKQHILKGRDCGSELMTMLWLKFVNNINAGTTKPLSFSFITLRSAQSNNYCNMTRMAVNRHRGIGWTDRATSFQIGSAPPPSGLDVVHNPFERCGDAYLINATALCLSESCLCGDKG